MTEVHLAIDGDLLLYRVLAATEHEANFGDGVWLYMTRPEEAFETLKAVVADRLKQHDASRAYLCLSDLGGANFRKTLWPEYKAHRTGRKPMCYALVQDWVLAETELWTPVHRPAIEADDCIGIMASLYWDRKDRLIILSNDKDLKGVAGYLAPLWYEEPGGIRKPPKVEKISRTEAALWHLRQTMTGDPAEGYRGCPGWGPKKWEKMVEEVAAGLGDHEEVQKALWPEMVAAYEKAGLTGEDCLLNARLAKILTKEEWDKRKQEPKLWKPPITD